MSRGAGIQGGGMRLRGILVASAALGLMAGGLSCSPAEGGEVECAGVNGCAGKRECSAADGSHDCGGKNSCKGKGWVHTDSAEECTEKGGTVRKG